ncbi:MAG TPA: AraC family transcriptional regulator [Ramlibacter sp.]|nr:AraC family transcriptional regulator [Ramlibacter sp.]
MLETPIRIEPSRPPTPGGGDLLSDVLQRIHLASAVFLRGEFTAPWAFSSVDEGTMRQLMQLHASRLVLFHVAVEGSFTIELASGEHATAHAGDAVVLPYCDEHVMGFPQGTTPVPISTLVPMPPWDRMPVVCHGGGGDPTRILCGYLLCDDLLFNPVLRALPRLIHVRPSSPQAAQWREASLRYTVEQAEQAGIQAAPLLSRLPEMVLVDCLRQYAQDLPQGQAGWLGALGDPVLGRALMLLHARPGEAWTVNSLATRVAVSRSILADRFVQALGVSPIRYLAQWRMQLAANLLRDEPRLGLGDVASRVGYESEAAFSRAFKRHLAVSPASWRKPVAPQ